MELPPPTLKSLAILLTLLFSLPPKPLGLCSNKCGPLDVRYPLGTDPGCGSPSFHPSVACTPAADGGEDRLTLTTHTGTYPVTSVSYSDSTLTISPPLMSTCSSMHPSAPNLGLDWSSTFQLGPSLFVLLSCPPPTSSLSYRGAPICDSSPSAARLCAALHACSSVLSLGLPIFAPTNTCCVYSPASLEPRGSELDLQGLRCSAYSSVVSFGATMPTDPTTWEYGVVLRYGQVGVSGDGGVAVVCAACERSGGVCGYAPPGNDFACVCGSGVNTTTDCAGQDEILREYNSHLSGDLSVISRDGILISFSFKVVFIGCWWLVMEGRR